MLLLYIWFARIRTGSLHDFFFVYYFYSRTFRFLFACLFFCTLVNKTRRKQSVNPIHKLRSTCNRLTIIRFFVCVSSLFHSHCMLSDSFSLSVCVCLAVFLSFFGSTKSFHLFIQIFINGQRTRFHI